MTKQSLFTIAVILLSLTLFLVPHTKIIRRPLIGLHDMDNGHLLTTVYLWRSEGILKHHLAPIYSFPPGDINLRTWGVVGKNNRMYHASYPPLSFWLVYLTSYLPGVGISEAAARLTSLAVFIIALSFLFVYLYATYNLPTAIFASGLFSLVPSSVYFFGGVIVADTALFAFWIPAFVLLAFYRRRPQKILLLVFSLFLALAVFSEWLGLLTAVSLSFYFLYRFLSKKDSKLNIIASICLAASIPLLVTAVIYLSIATPANLFHFLVNKYLNRGGFITYFHNLALKQNLTPTLLNGLSVWSHRVILGYLWPEFTPFFWMLIFISIAACFFLILIKALKRSKNQLMNKICARTSIDNNLIIAIFLIPPLLHTSLLSSFHYLHDYSFLSWLPFFILITAKGFFVITSLIENRITYRWKPQQLFSLTTAAILLLLFYWQAQNAYRFFFVEQTGGWMSTIKLFKTVRAKTNPDDLIITNHDYYPDRWFYLRRNGIMWVKKQTDLNSYTNYFSLFPRVFYTSDYRPFYDAVCENKPTIPVAHGWMCQIK